MHYRRKTNTESRWGNLRKISCLERLLVEERIIIKDFEENSIG